MADLKASLCGELPNQESVIPKEQLRNLLERRGIVGDPDIPNAKARLAEQELRRNMYHNTQVMLKHYRDIVWALECFPSEVAQELDQPLKDLDALLSVVDTQVALGNAKLEHRLLSIRKSRLLLDRINEALTVLRHKPGNGELMYNIIFQTFITPDKPSHSDINQHRPDTHSLRSGLSMSESRPIGRNPNLQADASNFGRVCLPLYQKRGDPLV